MFDVVLGRIANRRHCDCSNTGLSWLGCVLCCVDYGLSMDCPRHGSRAGREHVTVVLPSIFNIIVACEVTVGIRLFTIVIAS